MAFAFKPYSDDEKLRGDLKWKFWRLMVDEQLLCDDLANAEDPVWRSARTYIDSLPLMMFGTDVMNLYKSWKITVLHASP